MAWAPVSSRLPGPPWLWRVAAGVLAAALAAGAFVSFAFGGCHDAGGFCASEFGSTHVDAYASASVLAGLAALVVARLLTRRWAVVLVAAAAGALLTVAFAVILESSSGG